MKMKDIFTPSKIKDILILNINLRQTLVFCFIKLVCNENKNNNNKKIGGKRKKIENFVILVVKISFKLFNNNEAVNKKCRHKLRYLCNNTSIFISRTKTFPF